MKLWDGKQASVTLEYVFIEKSLFWAVVGKFVWFVSNIFFKGKIMKYRLCTIYIYMIFPL